jgi:hypothetical protein
VDNPHGVSFFKQGRIFLRRVPYESDLLEFLTEFATKNRMQMGTLFVIGAVKKAAVDYYDQQNKTYRQILINENMEILSCMGNVSIRENKPFVHCHACFSNGTGQTLGGHLAKGTIVFAAEAHFQEVLGMELVREHEPITKLFLWTQD